MSKYNIDLDLNTKNSLSVIIQRIKPNSTVLEFGPANGRMTKYLNSVLECTIYAVELDPEAAKDAANYCTDIIVGNIEDYEWLDQYKNIKFDHIIFADVLEHLYNPQKVLSQSKNLLNNDGSILISLPNVAHNAIIMDLIDDQFTYRSTGLLDDTHIRFFTKHTIDKFIENAKLHISYETGIYLPPQATEFGRSYIDSSANIASTLFKREYGEVYQFIVEAKKEMTEPVHDFKKENISLLFYDRGNGFNSNDVIKTSFVINKDFTASMVFDLENQIVDVKALRIDPFEYTCKLKIKKIIVNNEEVNIKLISYNGVEISDQIYFFMHHDPQIILELEHLTTLEKVEVHFDVLSDVLDTKILEKDHQLQQKNQQLQKSRIALDNMEEHKQSLLIELDNVYNSKRWKLFSPIDKLKEKNLSKKIYIFIKSNKSLRTLYHKLPISNTYRWKIRQFINTGKFQKAGITSLVEDRLDLFKYDKNCSEFPLVSIIIPCYNQGCYLWESVPSAFASYSGEVEVIIVNDGSTDGRTIKCLREIKMFFPQVQILDKANGGLSSARNAGIEIVSGKYIQFLDADDILAPGKIDAQISYTENEYSVMVSNYLTCDENSRNFFKTEETVKGFDYTLDNFLYKWERGLSVPIHCGLFPKKIFDEIKFDTELSAKEDWFFWISLLQKDYQIKYIDVHSVVYRIHTESMVRQSFVKMSQQWEKAYHKIADIVTGDQRKTFIDESKKWLENYYRSNPNYQKELQSKNKAVETKSLQPNTIDEKGINTLIEQFQDFGDKKPVISVIVPVYNHYDYLFQCFESITRQGSVPIELICVNDNSSDKRVENLLSKMEEIPNVTVIEHSENKGISYTQNEAVSKAKGEYIAFLDCDDYLKDGALEYIYEQIKNSPEVDYFFTDRSNIDENNKTLYDAVYKTVQSSNGIKSDLLDRMVASHLKVIKKETYLEVGGSDAKMSGIQDWDLALKIAEIGDLEYIEGSFYFHRLHENSVTSSDSVAQYKKTNILRREYAKRWLQESGDNIDQEKINDLLKSHQIDALLSLENVATFSPKNIQLTTWYCPEMLRKAFIQNKFCVMDARGSLEQSMIDFLKDFNSYFDLILCDRLSVSSQTIGTLWSEQIIWTPLIKNTI